MAYLVSRVGCLGLLGETFQSATNKRKLCRVIEKWISTTRSSSLLLHTDNTSLHTYIYMFYMAFRLLAASFSISSNFFPNLLDCICIHIRTFSQSPSILSYIYFGPASLHVMSSSGAQLRGGAALGARAPSCFSYFG